VTNATHTSTPDRRLTAAAIGAFVVGALADLGTTHVGLQEGFTESNPLGVAAMALVGHPTAGIAAFKAGVMALTVACTWWLWQDATASERIELLYIPSGVGCLWAVFALWNTLVVSGVVGW
jgi:hypothetical protein